MLNIFGLNYNRPQSLQSDSTSENSQGSNDAVMSNCPCCGTYVKVPESVTKYKCSICQSTVTLADGSTTNEHHGSRTAHGMNFQSLKNLIRNCESRAIVGATKHEIYRPVEEYVESIFSSIHLLNRSFLLSHNTPNPSNINYRDLVSTYNLLTSLPTIRPFFKLLLAANDLLRRPPTDMSKVSNIRWLLILFEIPGLADCLYHERRSPHQGRANRLNVPEIKTLSYEIIKRIIGYLAHSNSESLDYLSHCLMSLHAPNFAYKVQLLNLYITFHLTRLINRNSSSRSSGLNVSNKTNQLAANSPTLTEYNESSKLNGGSNLSSSSSINHLNHNTTSTRTWIQLPLSIQNGFTNWGDWRSVLSLNNGNGVVSEAPKTAELKLKLSDYGQEWHLKSAARLLSVFFVANRDKLPTYTFYNTLVDYVHVKQDFENWENTFKKPSNKNNSDSLVYDLIRNGIATIHSPGIFPPRQQFTFCQYPFLLSLGAKISILEYEARKTMEKKAEEAFLKALDKRTIIDVNLKFKIRRDHITIDSLNCIKKNQTDLKKALRIEFVNEPGIDIGGLKKEWFLLLTKELFNVKGNGMFTYHDDSHLCWFASMPVERNDELYYMLGVVLGLAIYNSIILDLSFPLALYKKLLNKKVTLDDYIQISPTTGEGIKKILSYKKEDFDNLGLTFETEFEDFYGNVVSRPLVSNGDKIEVNYFNRKDYVNKWVDFYLNKIIEPQFKSFYNGFHLVIGGNALSLFAPKEIEMLICGYNESKIETESFRAITKYNGWHSPDEAMDSNVVKWFWEWFENLNYAKQKLFLTFVTGSDRIPATGISTMSFKITRLRSLQMEKVRKLPVAHTCFNELCIYDYESKQEMMYKLDMSVMESEGFGLK